MRDTALPYLCPQTKRQKPDLAENQKEDKDTDDLGDEARALDGRSGGEREREIGREEEKISQREH